LELQSAQYNFYTETLDYCAVYGNERSRQEPALAAEIHDLPVDVEEIFNVPITLLIDMRELSARKNIENPLSYDIIINNTELAELNERNKPEIQMQTSASLKSNDTGRHRFVSDWDKEIDVKIGFHFSFDPYYKNYRKSFYEQKKNNIKKSIDKQKLNKEIFLKQNYMQMYNLDKRNELCSASINYLLSELDAEQLKFQESAGDILLVYKKYEEIINEASEMKKIELERIMTVTGILYSADRDIREYFERIMD